jgi:hypothetical protein
MHRGHALYRPRRTLRRWLTDDAAFKAEYDRARQALYPAGMARVLALTGKSVATLEELLDAKKSPLVRLGATRTSSSWASISATRRPSCGTGGSTDRFEAVETFNRLCSRRLLQGVSGGHLSAILSSTTDLRKM